MPAVTAIRTRWGDITPDSLAEIKRGYNAAKVFRPPAESFTLSDGQIMLTAFAKYLIEYCEAQGLVAADDPMNATTTLNGHSIERGQQIVSEFFTGITSIVAHGPEHIAIYKGEDCVAIIGSPALATALHKGVGH